MNLIAAKLAFLKALVSEVFGHLPGADVDGLNNGQLHEMIRVAELITSNAVHSGWSQQQSIVQMVESLNKNCRALVDPPYPHGSEFLAVVCCILRQAVLVPLKDIDLNGISNALSSSGKNATIGLMFPKGATGTGVSDEARNAIRNYFEKSGVGPGDGPVWYVRISTEDESLRIYTDDPDEESRLLPLLSLPISLLPELELRKSVETPSTDQFAFGDMSDFEEFHSEDPAQVSVNGSPTIVPPPSYWLLDVKKA